MRKTVVLVILVFCISVSIKAQLCNNTSSQCYKDNACFQASEIRSRDYKFSTVTNSYSSATRSFDLYLTVYSPCDLPEDLNSAVSSTACQQCMRPFMMLIHGGGFRTGCRTLVAKEALEFAKRGYVVAAIDYRLGWVPEDKKNCGDFCFTGACGIIITSPCRKSYKDSLDFAVYRAIQDASAAMRFIAHYANNLNIDTSNLYIGGYSAGSIIASNLTYMTQNELNLAMPKAYAKLGAFNTYGNSFTNKYRFAGLFNNWGCLSDITYINGVSDKIPMIAFHGLDDDLVPIDKGNAYGCRNNAAYGASFGSRTMYTRLVNRYPGMPVELYTCYGGHGILDGNPASDNKVLYRIQKAICFFNRVRNGDKSRAYIEIDKNEKDITYQELTSTSPVNCTFNLNKNAVAYTTNVSGISAYNKKLTLGITPNPVMSSATLTITGNFNSIDVLLTNPVGKILWKKENTRSNNIQLPVNELPAGVYIVQVKNNDWTGTIHFLKSGNY